MAAAAKRWIFVRVTSFQIIHHLVRAPQLRAPQALAPGSHRCQAVVWLRATLHQIIHHLAMVATRRWFGFGWRHNNASTIWHALPSYAFQVATAAKRWFGFERRSTRSSTIWRWWLQEVDGLRATLYQIIHHLARAPQARAPGSHRCQAVVWLRAKLCQIIHHLAMVATRRWFGFERRFTSSSTIWRWWLQEVDGLRSTLYHTINHLAMVATRRWLGFGWRHNNASAVRYALLT